MKKDSLLYISVISIILIITVIFPSSVGAKIYEKNGFTCDDTKARPGGVPCIINVGLPTGRMIYSGNYGTALKYDTQGNLIICVEHEKGQPDGTCVLKYQNYYKYVVVGLGGALHRASMNGLEDQKYIDLALAQNNILYKLGYYVGDITQPFYTSKVQDYENAGLQDAVDYYHYDNKNSTLGNLNLTSSLSNNIIDNPDTSGRSTFDITFGINTNELSIIHKNRTVTKKISYDNYTIDSVLLNNKKISYSENCDKKGNNCKLTINQNLLKSGSNNIKVIVKIQKRFYEAALYDCTNQDVTFSQSYEGELKSATIKGELVIRVPNCEENFNSLINENNRNDLQLRYMLYNKWYEQKGDKYNNLFNLNYGPGEGDRACSVSRCDNNYNMSCLNYSKDINSNDFSCFSGLNGFYYNETDYHLNYICSTNFRLTNELETTNFNIVPGMKIPGTEGKIATAILTKICSASANPGAVNSSVSFDPYIIDSLTFNNDELNYELRNKYSIIKHPGESNESTEERTIDGAGNNVTVNNLENGNSRIEFYYDIYAPNNIFLKKGTGEKVDPLSDSAIEAERGIYTQYNWRKSLTGTIPFTITFKNNSENGTSVSNSYPVGNKIYKNESRLYLPNYIEENDNTKNCKYNWNGKGLFQYCNGDCNETKKLNLEFRVIDTDHSFVKKDGSERNTMTNWCGEKNGEISCASDNSIVKKYIKENTNSYNQKYNSSGTRVTGDGAKYKITLTPSLMNDIVKNYHDKLPYNDFNLECRDKTNLEICKDSTLAENKIYETSELLTYLKENENLIINNSTKR